jgi:hypothetical protein
MLTIEESQEYQNDCENVTSKRGRDIKLFVRECYIEERQRHQIVYVNVTSISNSPCECLLSKRARDIKLFVRMLHRREAAGISNCSCKCCIEERQRHQIVCERMLHIEDRQQGYQIVHVSVASKRGRDIKLFVRMLHRKEAGISN